MIPKEFIINRLKSIREKGLRRTLRPFPAPGGRITHQDRTVLNFSSNDYLNLANNPRLKQASQEAVERFGCSAAASRLMSGTLSLHGSLEEELARFAHHESALVFGSGFLTNLGVLSALAGRKDAIFEDRLNHASLIDGARLSSATLYRYHHNDTGHLESLLKRHKTGKRIIATDSVFSMDGDCAPVDRIARIAAQYDAILIVDEAHATGVLGQGGGGISKGARRHLPDDSFLMIGTLSKALGSYGGFAAGSKSMKELLINSARSFIFSTALPPACAAGAAEALRIIRENREEGNPHPGEVLLTRASHFRNKLQSAGFQTGRSSTHIIPVMAGDNEKAVELSKLLSADGIEAVAIRPPTVPAGTARLRLSLTLAHTQKDLTYTLEKLIQAAEKTGITP